MIAFLPAPIFVLAAACALGSALLLAAIVLEMIHGRQVRRGHFLLWPCGFCGNPVYKCAGCGAAVHEDELTFAGCLICKRRKDAAATEATAKAV